MSTQVEHAARVEDLPDRLRVRLPLEAAVVRRLHPRGEVHRHQLRTEQHHRQRVRAGPGANPGHRLHRARMGDEERGRSPASSRRSSCPTTSTPTTAATTTSGTSTGW
ncbi:MAG: hypothetical protein M0C28_18195 [Candidatus Moduliflexus flocculans]|nr:hypothetical protein [Candidatus Moduliflexus flocculans]